MARAAREMTEKSMGLSAPRSLVELAYQELLSMLMSLKIQPGARISIEALSREMAISQTPIREALSLLEAQKLALKTPNVGYRAADLLTLPQIDALFGVRLMLEPAAAALAARLASDEVLAQLAALAQDMVPLLGGEQDMGAYTGFVDKDTQLHRLITEASGNPFLAEVVEGLHSHLHLFRFFYDQQSVPQASLSEHDALIAALLARDEAAAEGAMRAHLEGSHARVTQALSARAEAALSAARSKKKAGGQAAFRRARRQQAAKS